MSQSEIQSAIPHRPPMLLVDEIVEQSEDRIVCRKTFHAGEFFFQGHYPGYPLVPGVILCESAMQAGAILLSRFVAEEGGVPVATRMNEVKFKQMVRPGDTVEMTVELTERLGGAFFLKARTTKDGKTAVSFEFACAMAAIE
jgi:3-hydroxyacyl-[acyl-carrier-protein] dehydratase